MTQPAPPNAQKSPDQREAQTPLQILPAMLHAVFCQTADVFNAPHRQQPRAVMYTNAQIRLSVSGCNERFQYALDLLEMDILKAKATLRRDLSAIRAAAEAENAKRLAALEAAAALERARLEALARKQREAEEAEEARKRKEEEAEAAQRKKEQEEKEEEEARRQDTIMQDLPAEAKLLETPTAGSFDFLFDDVASGKGTAPPAPMTGNNGFDDFLADLANGEGAGEHDVGMGGGQPLEDSDLFEFNDFFGYGGT